MGDGIILTSDALVGMGLIILGVVSGVFIGMKFRLARAKRQQQVEPDSKKENKDA